MEDEKYNLEKAQEEANKLKQRIKSGENSSYEKAEESLENDQRLYKEKLLYLFQVSDIEEILKMARGGSYFDLYLTKNIMHADIIQSAEIQQAAKEEMLYLLKSGHSSSALEIKNGFNLPEEFMQSPRVHQAAGQGMMNLFESDLVDNARNIRDEFNLPEEVVRQAAKDGMMFWFKKWWFDNKKGNNFDKVLKIKEGLNLPEEVVQQVAKEAAAYWLNTGYADRAIEVKNKFNLPEENI